MAAASFTSSWHPSCVVCRYDSMWVIFFLRFLRGENLKKNYSRHILLGCRKIDNLHLQKSIKLTPRKSIKDYMYSHFYYLSNASLYFHCAFNSYFVPDILVQLSPFLTAKQHSINCYLPEIQFVKAQVQHCRARQGQEQN